jgi:photosystem II stability/assembly factor-like uncharacterized protein
MSRRGWILAIAFAAACGAAHAQWEMENSGTTADLRGIDNVGGGVAWASGTNGTVLRTEDGGNLWQACAVPPGTEHLDFRGVQAFDANTAIVMSSGKADLSRLYKTTDGCHTWKLEFTNPYVPDGFFDAILFIDRKHGMVFSDPGSIDASQFVEAPWDLHIRVTADGGAKWGPVSAPDAAQRPGDGLHPYKKEGAFAASNTSMAVQDGWFWFATSSSRVASRRLYETAEPPQYFFQSAYCAGVIDSFSGECGQPWTDFRNSIAPINHSSESAGIFSIQFRTARNGVVVGGDYLKPDDSTETAAYSIDGGVSWRAPHSMPHGYRSAVAYDAMTRTWITVGPNGTDISTDDGKNWRAVHPDPAMHEAPDADRDWHALSLPFVVGPHGRIGKLNPKALTH